ncbi:MAG: GntR family transcriptional regulator [Flavobacteriaceae bacterium]
MGLDIARVWGQNIATGQESQLFERMMSVAGRMADRKPATRETVVDRLRRILSDEIVTGVLGPGVRLDEQSLADRFEVSRTPIRETLSQLSALGLVEKRPHKGVVVLVQSRERLLQLFEVMAELEGTCARFAAERMSAEEKQGLHRLHELSAACVAAEDRAGYEAINTKFHQAIYDGTHNPALVETAYEARRRVFHFRSAQFRIAERISLSHAEHERVIEAIDARDGNAAYESMKAHILTVREAAASVVETSSDSAL